MRMFQTTYSQEFDASIHERVRRRFSRDREVLAARGFQELCFYNEQFGIASTLLALPVFLVMRLKGEVVRIRRRLDASATFLLMSHRDPQTIALPFAMGVNLYSAFTDGTLLISGNFRSCVEPVDHTIVKPAPA